MHRIKIFLLLNLLWLQSEAAMKTAADFHGESQHLMKQAQTKIKFEEKRKYILQLEKSLDSALEDYKKKNLEKADKQEREVSLFHSRLSSAFELAKRKTAPNSETCARSKQQVYTEANIDIEEKPIINPEVQETLKWIDVLCAEVKP